VSPWVNARSAKPILIRLDPLVP